MRAVSFGSKRSAGETLRDAEARDVGTTARIAVANGIGTLLILRESNGRTGGRQVGQVGWKQDAASTHRTPGLFLPASGLMLGPF
jgi:hypothetical protein